MSAVMAAAACYHCGLPVPPASPWRVQVDGAARAMCCPGCAAAAEAILGAGCGDYYSERTEFAARSDEAAIDAPELALYDEGHNNGDATFSVDGIRCAACVWLIERRLAALPGVRGVAMNIATERLHVSWDSALCRPSAILGALRAIGYRAAPYDAERHGERLERARKKLFRQLFVAGLSMMQVMMYALPVYLAGDGTMDADMTALMQWASLLLTLPAVAYSAQPFFGGAWRDLQRGMPGMDVPVALGIGAAFGASVLALLRGSGEVWFDSVTMFIFLLLASRYLELSSRRKAAQALEALQHALPASALRMADYPASRHAELVPAARLQQGDIILLQPGQAAAADGIVIEGETEADLALLTGESAPRRIGLGERLPGGAVNAAQAVLLQVTRPANDSTLALLVRLTETAGQGKPQVAQWADRVAAWFVVGLLVLTVAVFVAWQLVDPARAWQAAIAVLVVSCPCALSLATPTALAAANDRLLRRGVLAVKPHVLETLQRATHVIFDKTGTLTAGRPSVRGVLALGTRNAAACLRLAASLEAANAHPLGLAIRAAAGPVAVVAEEPRYLIGQGAEGTVDGVRYRVGNANYVSGLTGLPPPDLPATDGSQVWIGSAGCWIARFDLADGLRPEAAEVVRRFREAGKAVILLSGDDQESVRAVARQLGIDNALGGQLPEMKLGYVRALQEGGAVVAMVGDGVNDAAVLSGADVSFALSGGAALAQLHADCVLLGQGLTPLADAADAARRTLAVIRQNLAWASVYNLVAIPAAASGLLNPWLSGVGMAASSAIVVLNALRLRRGI